MRLIKLEQGILYFLYRMMLMMSSEEIEQAYSSKNRDLDFELINTGKYIGDDDHLPFKNRLLHIADDIKHQLVKPSQNFTLTKE